MGAVRFLPPAPGPAYPDGRLRLSLVGQCPRRVAYHLHRYPYTPHPYMDHVRRDLSLAVGTAVHNYIRERIVGLRDVEREVRVPLPNSEIELVGHIDGIVRGEDGVERLLELKTASPWSFKEMVSRGPEDAYRRQAHLYLYGLQLAGEPIAEVAFVLVDKGSGAVHVHVEPYDEGLAISTLETVAILYGLPPEGVPPPYAPSRDGKLPWQCTYCPFWAHCWPNATPLPGPALALP